MTMTETGRFLSSAPNQTLEPKPAPEPEPEPELKPKCIALLSGGLDSTTAMAHMINKDIYQMEALSFSYHQRHDIELAHAQHIAEDVYKIPWRCISLGTLPQSEASALTGNKDVPKGRALESMGDEIPCTYVPGRNILFLAYAIGYAESVGAHDIVCGVNALDYSGYPDCRPEFIAAFTQAVNLGTKEGVKGHSYAIYTPLIHKTKAGIIAMGLRAGVDYGNTWSCYDPTSAGRPCGQCDSCLLRAKGFQEMNMHDPALSYSG